MISWNDDYLTFEPMRKNGIIHFIESIKDKSLIIISENGKIKGVKGYKEVPFPKLMMAIDSEFIVYFIKEGCGVVVDKDTDSIPNGVYCVNFCMDEFIDYKGKVTMDHKTLRSIVLHSK